MVGSQTAAAGAATIPPNHCRPKVPDGPRPLLEPHGRGARGPVPATTSRAAAAAAAAAVLAMAAAAAAAAGGWGGLGLRTKPQGFRVEVEANSGRAAPVPRSSALPPLRGRGLRHPLGMGLPELFCCPGSGPRPPPEISPLGPGLREPNPAPLRRGADKRGALNCAVRAAARPQNLRTTGDSDRISRSHRKRYRDEPAPLRPSSSRRSAPPPITPATPTPPPHRQRPPTPLPRPAPANTPLSPQAA